MNLELRLMRRKVRPLQQMEAAECGVTCLAMVLAYHGAAIPLDELRTECGTSRDGNSALQLLEAARRLGLEGRGLRLDVSELERAQHPLILHWRLNHFVVLEGWRGGRALLVDPASGRVQVDREQVDACFSGIALELEPTPALVRRKPRAFGVAQYFANLRRRLPAVAFILVAGACTQLLGLVPPALSQVLIDEVLRAARTSWLLPLLAVLIGANIAGLVLRWLYQVAIAQLQAALSVALTEQVGRRLLSMPLDFIESRSRSDLLQRVSSYAGLGKLLTQTATGAFDMFFALALMALMLAYDPALGALAVGIDLLRVLGVRYLREDARQRSAGELAARARELSVVLQATASAETTKAFGLEKPLEAWYSRRLAERIQWTIRSERLGAGAAAILSIFHGVANAAVLWVGGTRVIEQQMAIGVFAGFLAIRSLLGAPLASVLSTLERWIDFRGVLTRTDEFAAHPPLERGQRTADALAPRLELSKVGFRYGSGAPWVFRGVDLTIEPGQHVALIGPSGQGKSTLLKIMSGILEPTEGRVLLDGVALSECDPESLARSIGALLGDPLVLEGSIRENLTLRLPEASDAAILEAADAARFAEVVARAPHGYATRLEPQGTNLSGGERQRLGLARALLGQPRLLFLDEATCFLDAKTEGDVIGRVLRAGLTSVSVAHRPAVVDACDRVYLVQDGQVRLRPRMRDDAERVRAAREGEPPREGAPPDAPHALQRTRARRVGGRADAAARS